MGSDKTTLLLTTPYFTHTAPFLDSLQGGGGEFEVK